MNIKPIDANHFRIECVRDDMIILANAINNLPQAVDRIDFTTLLGGTETQVSDIHRCLLEALGHRNETPSGD